MRKINSTKTIPPMVKYIIVGVITAIVTFCAGFMVRGLFVEEEPVDKEIVEEASQDTFEDISVRVYDGEIQYYQYGTWHFVETVDDAISQDPMNNIDRPSGVYADDYSAQLVRKVTDAPVKEVETPVYTGGYNGGGNSGGGSSNNQGGSQDNQGGTSDGGTGDGEDLWSGDIL